MAEVIEDFAIAKKIGTGLSFEEVVKSVIPFLIVSLIILFIVTYWAEGMLFLPGILFK